VKVTAESTRLSEEKRKAINSSVFLSSFIRDDDEENDDKSEMAGFASKIQTER